MLFTSIPLRHRVMTLSSSMSDSKGLSMSGLLPAFLRYTEMYEKGRCRNRARSRERNEEEGKPGPSVMSTVHASSTSSTAAPNRATEREKALLACMPAAPDKANGGKNYAVLCLKELYDRSRKRAAPDLAAMPPPPPLLLQTLLWLFIRSEEGEGDLIQVLLPYCERAALSLNSAGEEIDRNKNISPYNAVSPLKTQTVPDVDLEFLMRECKR